MKGKGQGTGKGKSAKKKLGKVVIVVSSDSEDLEVDFPHHPPNQPVDTPAEEPQEPTQPLHIPAEEARELQEPNQPVPMANNHFNWSHFKPDFSGKPEEDMEAHLLKTNDWMNIHDFPNDQKVRRFCLTLLGEVRLWYESLNIQQQQLDWAGLKGSF